MATGNIVAYGHVVIQVHDIRRPRDQFAGGGNLERGKKQGKATTMETENGKEDLVFAVVSAPS